MSLQVKMGGGAITINLFAKAKTQIMLKHPFFATLTGFLPTVERPGAWFDAMGCPRTACVDGKRIYYAGDTDLIDEMGELADVDLALLPVGGTYTLNGPEAAQACKIIGCKSAVPYHWGDIVGSPEDAKGFVDATECQGHVLQPGESLTL